jgi:hypothetical protein
LALRLPRGPRPRRPAARRRDLLAASVAAAALVVFGLRIVMAALNVRTWTLGWRVINLPTAPFVGLARRLHPLAHVLVGHLTLADVLVAGLAWLAAMLVLAAAANRGPA